LAESGDPLMLKELFSKRFLLKELVLKNLKLRYSGAGLGFFWSLLSPFLTVLVFYAVFSLVLKVKTSEAPFILYLMIGVFTWRFFQGSLLSSVSSLSDNRNLTREASFPYYFIPLSLVLTDAVDFLPSLVIMLVTCALLLQGLPLLVWVLPFVLLIHFSLAVGLSVIFSILYVRRRDIKYILDVVLLLLFYLTPAFYSIFLVKESFPGLIFKLYLLNPLVCVLTLYRMTLLKGFYAATGGELSMLTAFLVSLAAAIAVLGLAFWYYRVNKDKINDYLSY
jgi:lipopolysaccharide transport system permease protein